MTQSTFGEENLLPLINKVSSQTIAKSLVSVQPMPSSISEKKLKKIKDEINQLNRESKIESIVEGSEYKESKVEDHSDYKSVFGSDLFYIDYMYDNFDPNKEDTNSV